MVKSLYVVDVARRAMHIIGYIFYVNMLTVKKGVLTMRTQARIKRKVARIKKHRDKCHVITYIRGSVVENRFKIRKGVIR